MKPRYIIGGVIIIALFIFAYTSFQDKEAKYTDFTNAKTSGEKVVVNGQWLKDMDYGYNPENNQFSFYMTDENKKSMKVIYYGQKPNNFEMADEIVVKGQCSNEMFIANEILTKCPSKYEGTAEDLKKS